MIILRGVNVFPPTQIEEVLLANRLVGRRPISFIELTREGRMGTR